MVLYRKPQKKHHRQRYIRCRECTMMLLHSSRKRYPPDWFHPMQPLLQHGLIRYFGAHGLKTNLLLCLMSMKIILKKTSFEELFEQSAEQWSDTCKTAFAFWAFGITEQLEPVHIKIASKIIAKVRFPKYRTSSLS